MKRLFFLTIMVVMLVCPQRGYSLIMSPDIIGDIGTSFIGGIHVPDHINPGNPFVTYPNPSDEHRGICEFDLSLLPSDFYYTLEFTYTAFKYDYGTWKLSCFSGDGLLTLDDWGRPTQLVSFFETQEYTVEQLFFDVTDIVSSASGNYLGFRIEGFSLNAANIRLSDIGISGQPIPEPSTIVLITCGLLGLLGICVKRRRKAK